MSTENQNGVFISTDRIYDLLRDSIDSTNEKLTEIRSDIRSMNEQNNEVKAIALDHEKRMRAVEEKLNKFPISTIAAILAAVAALVTGYMKLTGK